MLTETLPTTLPSIKLPALPMVEKQFNWLTVLQELVDGRELDPCEHHDLVVRAMSWPMCACGQLCKLLPKYDDGRPMDETLINWGVAFYTSIIKRDWQDALYIFKKIEERSAILLNEMGVAC